MSKSGLGTRPHLTAAIGDCMDSFDMSSKTAGLTVSRGLDARWRTLNC